MPEITPDERGRRVFQIQKERAVESAIERIRANLGQDWKLLSASDIAMLEFMLGEAWISIGRERWGRSSFSRLTKREIEAIAEIGKNVKEGEEKEVSAVRKVDAILERTM